MQLLFTNNTWPCAGDTRPIGQHAPTHAHTYQPARSYMFSIVCCCYPHLFLIWSDVVRVIEVAPWRRRKHKDFQAVGRFDHLEQLQQLCALHCFACVCQCFLRWFLGSFSKNPSKHNHYMKKEIVYHLIRLCSLLTRLCTLFVLLHTNIVMNHTNRPMMTVGYAYIPFWAW